MYRTLSIAGVDVRIYGTFLLLAVVVCLGVGPRWAAALGDLDRRAVRRALWVVAIAPWIGGRLHYVLSQSQAFEIRPWKALEFWTGLHAGGAILALAMASPLIFRWYGLPVGRTADALTPTIGMGITIARLGCFLNGCCYGVVCAWPWCLRFPSDAPVHRHQALLGLVPSEAPWSLPVHPLQLYFAGSGLLVMATSLWLLRRKLFDGEVALFGLFLFSATSAWLESLRAEHWLRRHWGPMPQLQWIALATAAGALVVLVVARRRHR